MKPSVRLKLGTVFFTVFWIAAMLWWSGSFERASIIITAICGAIVGYGWYRFMRWQLRRSQVPQRSAPHP
jgi:hypothetical protein